MQRSQRPSTMIHRNNEDWISRQDRKIKVSRIPKNIGMRDIYLALSRHGKIVRIEMSGDAAYVTYQPPPQLDMPPNPTFIRGARVQIDEASTRRFPVQSPVNPNRKYHEANIMFANSIDFGITLAEHTLDIMRTVEASQSIQVTLSLGDRKELDFQFPFTIDGLVRQLRFRLPLSLVERVFRIETPEVGKCSLVIPFNSPPQFFLQSKAKGIFNTFNGKDRVWLDWNTWYRQTDITDAKTSERLKNMPVMNHYNEVIVDIGRWTTYRVTFDLAAVRGPQFNDFIDGLSDHGVHVKVLNNYQARESKASPMESLVEDEIFGTHPELAPSTARKSTSRELFTSRIHLNFAVRYQLEACLSNDWIKEHSITREFLEHLASMVPEEAVCLLEKVADRQHTYLDPMEIFKSSRKLLPKTIPSYCVFSRSANITPTMIHVSTPVVETSNRIIRKHAADADRFIRIKFSDEQTEGRLFSSDNDRSNAVFERIERAMRQGIVVAGRHYEFLAFGNSQFREHGAYFYAPTPSQSPNDIRQSMGQFEHIKTAAKYGARLGQCFSTTRAIKSINVKIERIPDIERNGFVFTDGVGRISPLLAKMAAKELGLQNPFGDPPSLFQFRLGGCKGVLALDPTINGSIVHIRPSQYKFEAQNVGLEIIRASALAVACFNRQLIIILSALGVPDTMFTSKQQEMVNYLERATKEESVALEKLQRNIDLNQTSLTMAGMILDGFMKHKDPFMMSLLQLWRAYNIKYLKEKARIVIEDGAFVLGCVDESAILRGHFEDPQSRADATREEKLSKLPEIFLQISDGKGYKIIEGVCVLARNPSLHCGDIRIVQAVDVPALHHLKNVVVLPQTGDRDLANMCSGGDLDGDDYIVLWDTDFIPRIINENPMDFTPEKPVESDRPITVQDITDFFVTYIKTDTLSRIATAHLAQADAKEEGVRDEVCLELARRHSQAVDYPKSGIPATMSRDLRPKKYPHFMESKQRPAHKTYKSNKVLGKLYDQVELVDFKPMYGPFDERILQAFQLDDAILEKARDIKSSYDSSLRRLMAKHAIKTEFEAWSIFVLSHNLESRDYTFAEEFGKTVGILKEQHRDICREAISQNKCTTAEFVAAMYTVTAKEAEVARMECQQVKIVGGKVVPLRTSDNMPLMSFPWLFVSELGKIATSGSHDERHQRLAMPGMKASTRKHTGVDPEPTMGGGGSIETAEGVTHYGELLKLDFSLGN
ncbi:RdRP-domain-containing protein [Periconia macrospinosa]|uniref:RNA-dependent RNA polymerase n=1 Tax=Periconia macrospinosa TaxID=97972 RepID=A0A2V1E8X8_9PLEO|nr:RdRP-domain-containing protein [Periconia macrospinosa]